MLISRLSAIDFFTPTDLNLRLGRNKIKNQDDTASSSTFDYH